MAFTVAYQDLTTIRSAFEEFERKLIQDVYRSVEKHGFDQTMAAHAKIAKIRKDLHDLYITMFPPAGPNMDLDTEGYM